LAKQDKILVVYSYRASFVAKDIDILSKKYKVDEYSFSVNNKSLLPFQFVKQLVFLLFNLPKYKTIICQFSGYHSFLPALLSKIFNIKCIIIACGADCVSYQSINYGNLRKPLYSWFTLKSYSLATYICPVHIALAYYKNEYYSADGLEQGIKAFLPNLKTPIIPIENGYDTTKWYALKRDTTIRFLTVAGFLKDEYRRILKGVDLVEQLAAIYPQFEFIIIGSDTTRDYSNDPTNLKRIGFIPNDKLVDYYNAATFYLQLSISEGFPNALSEAMACGCIPIVSNVSSMPDIIDNSGFILKERNLDSLNKLVESALTSDLDTLSAKAIQRIKNTYTEARRQESLFNVIEKRN
jgi:glycosyltransferase involved in cell wall biosynthesis